MQVVRRRSDARKYRAARLVPVHERFGAVGELAFWLALIAALVADDSRALEAARDHRHRPQPGRRHRAAHGWLYVDARARHGHRSLAARHAVGAHAHEDAELERRPHGARHVRGHRRAAGRLTRDPNTILFFLDHLDDAPTFRLENETSWNTNVEDAIYWGVKLVETDQEMYGPSKNARTFVVISDGQVWSGNVQRAIAPRRAAAFLSTSSASARRTAA